jgi:hypothetical protein
VIVMRVAMRRIQDAPQTHKPNHKPEGSFKEHSNHPKDST